MIYVIADTAVGADVTESENLPKIHKKKVFRVDSLALSVACTFQASHDITRRKAKLCWSVGSGAILAAGAEVK